MTQREFPTLDSEEKSYRLFPAVNKHTRPEARLHKWAEWDIPTHLLWTLSLACFTINQITISREREGVCWCVLTVWTPAGRSRWRCCWGCRWREGVWKYQPWPRCWRNCWGPPDLRLQTHRRTRNHILSNFPPGPPTLDVKEVVKLEGDAET